MDNLRKRLLDALVEIDIAKNEAREAKKLANEAMIEIKAMQKSTHRTVLVDPNQIQDSIKDIQPGEGKKIEFSKQSESEMNAKMQLENWHGIDFEQEDPMG